MNFKQKNALLAAAMLSVLAPLSINAFAVEGPVNGDAYISAAQPGQNFGAAVNLNVGNGDVSYIRVDLSTLPQGITGAQIAHASMLLWVNNLPTPGALDVSPVTSAGAEGQITLNTAPGLGKSLVTVPVFNANQFIVIDLTSIVKVWADYPAQNFGVALTPSSGQPGTVVFLNSKEAANDHAGILDITLQPLVSTGTAGPMGATGATGAIGPKGATGAAGPVASANLPGFNTAYGTDALKSITIDQWNTALGVNALSSNTGGSRNVASGFWARNNNQQGNNNTATGDHALGSNVSGERNTALGYKAITDGNGIDDAVAIGADAQVSNSLATWLGAGSRATNLNTTALGYTAMAFGCGASAIGAGSRAMGNNSLAIGNNAQAGSDNMIRLGDGAITGIQGQVGFTAASDSRLKEDILPLDSGTGFIMKLRPVSYRMKNPAHPRRKWGFIAQEIESLLGTGNAILTVGADSGRTLGLRYTDFIAPLVKTVQEQEALIDGLRLHNQQLQQALENQGNQLQVQISSLKVAMRMLAKNTGTLPHRKEGMKK